MKRTEVALFTVLLLGGCSVTDIQTEDSDWFDIGYRDGIKGRHARSYSQLREFGQANHAEYDQGYIRGIQEYCNPDVAYQIGLSGQYYEGVCEGTEFAQKFRMEWKRGWNESR
ncbi:hypothetical protein CSW98_11545 [Vibrio sp. HA2012]|uniref:DUF2799 domain-containing protein n=1 Tax=Vibrio sp. HA2012 TaxID=1971595 RepID=UPI000C2CA278|nr:DUF2799 domain-containing protein [Vibrio sp. HA2012]PJC86195.1 hypothetical protein CSW98_11545 [Vibrio sp. HA2012]